MATLDWMGNNSLELVKCKRKLDSLHLRFLQFYILLVPMWLYSLILLN